MNESKCVARLRQQQQYIHDIQPMGIVGSAVVSLILVAFYQYAAYQPLLSLWFAIMSLLIIARLVFFRAFRPKDDANLEEIRRHRYRYACLMLSFGLAWAFAGNLIFFEYNHADRVAMYVLLTGVLASGVLTCAGSLLSFILFSSPILLSFTLVHFFFGAREEMIMGALSFFYFSLLISLSLSHSQLIQRSLDLQNEKNDLIADLENEREKLERVNKRLKRELKGRVGMMEFLANGNRLSSETPVSQAPEPITHDPLTHSLNRAGFMHRFSAEWASARDQKRWLSIVMCDIDNLKSINEVRGYSSGDEVIIEFARIIERCGLRESDIVGRYSDDQFALLLIGSNEPAALIVAERIQRELAQAAIPTTKTNGDMQYVTTTIGVAAAIPSQDAPISLIKKADLVLFEAKKNQRGQAAAYSFRA